MPIGRRFQLTSYPMVLKMDLLYPVGGEKTKKIKSISLVREQKKIIFLKKPQQVGFFLLLFSFFSQCPLCYLLNNALFYFVFARWSKHLGSGSKDRVARVTENKGIFSLLFSLSLTLCHLHLSFLLCHIPALSDTF